MRKDKFSPYRLGYTHAFETTRKTTAYRNHIKNFEFKTREAGNGKYSMTPQTDLVTTLNNNPLTRSTNISKNEERHELELNLDPEPSSSESSSETSLSDSRANKNKRKKKKKRRKHQKDDSSDTSSGSDYDSSVDSYRHKQNKSKKHWGKDLIKKCATLRAKLMTTAYK